MVITRVPAAKPCGFVGWPQNQNRVLKCIREILIAEKKVEVIKHLQENPGTSIRVLGREIWLQEDSDCLYFENKESLFYNNSPGSRVHTSKSRTSQYAEVNEALYK